MRHLRRIGLVVAVLGAVWLLAPLVAGNPAPPNIIVVLADAMRADALDVDSPDAQPFLYDLAKDSTRFTRAYSSSSWTTPSVASLFTSRYPSRHRAEHFQSILPDDETTLAECLKRGGYRTIGFTTNILNAHPSFGQGFDAYTYVFVKDAGVKVRAPLVQKRLSKWLATQPPASKQPLFLYLHYLESHIPYQPPMPPLEAARLARARSGVAASTDPALRAAGPDGKDDDLRDLYAAEIRDLDGSLAGLFRMLGDEGLLENALVVFLSDHGEEFLEHGRVGHGATLFEESIRIPLLVRAPGQTGRALVTRPVSIVDIAPTLLDFAGIAVPAEFEGASFATETAGGLRYSVMRLANRVLEALGRRSNPPAYAELTPQSAHAPADPAAHSRTLVEVRYKAISTADDRVSVYDLAGDPGEQSALAPEGHDVAALLRRYARPTAGAAGAESVIELDDATRERLRALGYIAK